MQDGPLPTVLRLSDEAETAINLADPDRARRRSPGGCLIVTGYEGTAADVEARRDGRARSLLARCRWRAARSRTRARRGAPAATAAPYLRDPLLDAGALVETLETATFWSNVAALDAAVTAALTDALTAQGTPPLVLCHISHVYETGASLYFTVLCAQADDPLAQWAQAQGRGQRRDPQQRRDDHPPPRRRHRPPRRPITHEIGPLGVDALRAVKAALDPSGHPQPRRADR